MTGQPLHLLTLAPVADEDRVKLENTFDSVHYAQSPELSWNAGPPASVPQDVLEKATVVFGWQLPSDITHYKQTPNLKWMMTPSAGADKLLSSDFWNDEQTKQNVQLTNNSGVHCSVIPPYVISIVTTLFLDLYRNFESHLVKRHWERKNAFYMRELAGSTFGILGYGRLGRETARLAKAYGCKVIAATSDGNLKPDEESKEMCPGFGDPDGSIPCASYSTRDEAAFTDFLAQTDVLVVCLPGTPGTLKMINKERLAKLKKDAVLINIGRGAVVDTEALIESLESGHLGGAGLDVTDPEPLPDGHKLWTTPNVIITPHIAGLTSRYLSRSVDMLITNAERLKKGEKLLNAVDIVKGY